MKRIISKCFVCVFSLCTQQITAQNSADSLFNIGDLQNAIVNYKQLSTTDELTSEVNYKIASCYALMNRKNDSVFLYLDKAFKSDSSLNILSDPYFYSVINDSRWCKIESEQLHKAYMKNTVVDTILSRKLLNIKQKDQAYYYHLKVIQKTLGYSSPVSNAIWDLKNTINEVNIRNVIAILDSIGWPKRSLIGEEASNACFLVIQHSNVDLREKYIGLLKQACQDGEAAWKNFALMYDRIKVYKIEPQVYGTQLHYDLKKRCYIPFPIENIEKLNERRKKIGLGSIEDHYNRICDKWEY